MASLLLLLTFGEATRLGSYPDSKWQWILGKDGELDGIFVGSSHIWLAIDPRIVAPDKQLLNFGRSHYGRDVDYLIFREAVARVKFRELYLEIGDDEPTAAHREWSRLRSFWDILDETLYFSRAYPSEKDPARIVKMVDQYAPRDPLSWSDWKQHLEGAATTIADRATSLPKILRNLQDSEANSQKVWEGYDARQGYSQEIVLEKSKETSWAEVTDHHFWKPGVFVYREQSRYHYYLSKILRLAAQNDIQVSFLFVPRENGWMPSEQALETYRKMGRVIVPDVSEFSRSNLWLDPTHLSPEGSRLFSQQVKRALEAENHE